MEKKNVMGVLGNEKRKRKSFSNPKKKKKKDFARASWVEHVHYIITKTMSSKFSTKVQTTNNHNVQRNNNTIKTFHQQHKV